MIFYKINHHIPTFIFLHEKNEYGHHVEFKYRYNEKEDDLVTKSLIKFKFYILFKVLKHSMRPCFDMKNTKILNL